MDEFEYSPSPGPLLRHTSRPRAKTYGSSSDSSSCTNNRRPRANANANADASLSTTTDSHSPTSSSHSSLPSTHQLSLPLDAHSAQHHGNNLLLLDHLSYLLSLPPSTTSFELALLSSHCDMSIALAPLLTAVSRANGGELGLAVVAWFVGKQRWEVMREEDSLRGIGRLVEADPVVDSHLTEVQAGARDAGRKRRIGDSKGEAPCDRVTTDPTVFGRRRKKNRDAMHNDNTALEPIVEDDTHSECEPICDNKHPFPLGRRRKRTPKPEKDCLDFPSPSAPLPPPVDKIALALSRVNFGPESRAVMALGPSNDTSCHFCNESKRKMEPEPFLTPSLVALNAADHIISGEDTTCPVEETERDSTSLEEEQTTNDQSPNPIQYASELMRRSGSMEMYSRAMTRTLLAILRAEDLQRTNPCANCIAYLHHRASSLSRIVDNLCCLSPDTSRELSCPESSLIPTLLRVISAQEVAGTDHHEDVVATSLKTLTTLTHENSIACEQVLGRLPQCIPLPSSSSSHKTPNNPTTSGVELIFHHLFHTAAKPSNDSLIYSLNILTNICEMNPTPTRDTLSTLSVPNHPSGISWLTRYLVSQTTHFQTAIQNGSFGSPPDTHYELPPGEESNLLTAGNGFILLSYLMLDSNNSASALRIREEVQGELPEGGMRFVIRTLKAFCNLYHYSIGDLSVAVIGPVVRLMEGLERLEGRRDWL